MPAVRVLCTSGKEFLMVVMGLHQANISQPRSSITRSFISTKRPACRWHSASAMLTGARVFVAPHARRQFADARCAEPRAPEPPRGRAPSSDSACWANTAFGAAFCFGLSRSRGFLARRFSTNTRALKDTGARAENMLEANLRRLKDHAAALGGKCLAIGYKNRRTKVPWQCQHGHTWDAVPHSVLNLKTWCPECALNKRRIQLQRLQDHASLRGGRCLSTSKYNSSRTKVLWQCNLGHHTEQCSSNRNLVPCLLPQRANQQETKLEGFAGPRCFPGWLLPLNNL